MQYTALMLIDETGDSKFAKLVGRRVKEARVEGRLTLDDLAEKSGVSRRTIVSIEQGTTNVSIKMMLRISTSLGVGLASLLAEPSSNALGVIRSSAQSASWVGEKGGAALLVASTDAPEIFELWDWSLGPGDRYVSEAHSEGTHELIHVISGPLTLEVEGVVEHLETGDSASFSGTKLHSYSNSSGKLVRFSLSVLQPHLRGKVVPR